MFCSKAHSENRNPVKVASMRLLAAVLLSFGLGLIPSYFQSPCVLQTVAVLQQPVFFYMSWAFFQLIEVKNWRLGWHVFFRVLTLIIWVPFVIFNASILFSLIVTMKVCKETPDVADIPQNGDPKNDFLRDIALSCKKLQDNVSVGTLRQSQNFMALQTIVSVIILGAYGFEIYKFIRRRREYESVPTESPEDPAPAYELSDKI